VTTRRGSRVAVHDLGGSGPDLLICHATGFCGGSYRPLARVLSANFHVWALDFPGHGDSELPPDADFALKGMARDLVDVGRSLASTPLACVVGHSLGGAVALQAAADDPALAVSAYVYEPAILGSDVVIRAGSSNPMAESARRRRPGFASRAEALWRYAAKPPLGDLDAASLAAYVEFGFADSSDGSVTLKCQPESEARTFESSGGVRVSDIGAAALPTLCVTGGEVDSPLPTLVPPVVAALPNAVLRVHRHLGHFGPLQSPSLIGEDIANHALPFT
jgi:pimeloyl-ACP methyl ester carboxylesterase